MAQLSACLNLTSLSAGLPLEAGPFQQLNDKVVPGAEVPRHRRPALLLCLRAFEGGRRRASITCSLPAFRSETIVSAFW